MKMKSYYTYLSQEKRSIDFLLYKSRYLPEHLFKNIPSEHRADLMNMLILIEDLFRMHQISKEKARNYGEYIRQTFNIEYEILDDNHIIFLPRSSDAVLKYFLEEPTVIGFIGSRGSGKTISAWWLALQALEKIENATLHVYNDVDGLGALLAEENKRIKVEKEARVPPYDGLPKIVLYNEMEESQMGKRAMSSRNVELNIQAFRIRHRKAWIIQNIITYSGFESILRQTTTMKVFKWMDPELLETTKNNVPKGWKKLLEICAFFNVNEGLAIIPVKKRGNRKGGNIYCIHETNPPEWLLKKHKQADKDKHLLMVESEKEREYLKIIGEIKAKDPRAKAPDVQVIMKEKYGIELSVRRVRDLVRKWKILTGYEDEG